MNILYTIPNGVFNFALIALTVITSFVTFGGETWLKGPEPLFRRITWRGWASLALVLASAGVGLSKQMVDQKHDREKGAEEQQAKDKINKLVSDLGAARGSLGDANQRILGLHNDLDRQGAVAIVSMLMTADYSATTIEPVLFLTKEPQQRYRKADEHGIEEQELARGFLTNPDGGPLGGALEAYESWVHVEFIYLDEPDFELDRSTYKLRPFTDAAGEGTGAVLLLPPITVGPRFSSPADGYAMLTARPAFVRYGLYEDFRSKRDLDARFAGWRQHGMFSDLEARKPACLPSNDRYKGGIRCTLTMTEAERQQIEDYWTTNFNYLEIRFRFDKKNWIVISGKYDQMEFEEAPLGLTVKLTSQHAPLILPGDANPDHSHLLEMAHRYGRMSERELLHPNAP